MQCSKGTHGFRRYILTSYDHIVPQSPASSSITERSRNQNHFVS